MADKGKRDKQLLALTMENAPTPEIPDPYKYVVQSRYMTVPIFDGILDDMPYMFRLEITAALQGETEWNRILARNLELEATNLVNQMNEPSAEKDHATR